MNHTSHPLFANDVGKYLENILHEQQFGEVAIRIHDGRVVQIEHTQKKRFNRSGHDISSTSDRVSAAVVATGLHIIFTKIKDLRFADVNVTFQKGKVTQVNRTEKTRFHEDGTELANSLS